MSLLDIGTGCGVIAITLALELPFAEVAATDISRAALDLARDNAVRHSVQEKICFHEADLFPATEGRFNCIVANPPYIATAELGNLQPEIRHDPLPALDGGLDGLEVIRRLIKAAPGHLASTGSFAMEIGHNQATAVVQQLSSNDYHNIVVHRDYQGIERFVLASLP